MPKALTVVLILVLSGGISAGQTAESQSGKGKMSMGGMMQNCEKHCSATKRDIATLRQQIAEAKQSNDPAKMRAALDAAEKPLSEMNQHMDRCMGMMKMMDKHHGMGMESAEPKSPDKSSEPKR
jgi:hypothetical protein